MASTYSTNLKVELMGAGDQTGTWGDTTNSNLGTCLEQAIVGNATVSMPDADATLASIGNGPGASPSRAVFQRIDGTLTANRILKVPSNQKNYIFFNNTNYDITISIENPITTKPNVVVNSGQVASVYVDGTAGNGVYPYVNSLVSGTTLNGVGIADISSAQTLLNKTLTTPVLTNPNSSTGTFATPTISSPTVSGTVTSTAIITGNKSYRNNVNAIGSVTTTLAIDCALGDIVTATLGGNPTVSFSNVPTTGNAVALTLIVTQDATGSRTITWPSSVYADGGSRATNLAPVANASSTTIYSLFTTNGGTVWYAVRLNSSRWLNT